MRGRCAAPASPAWTSDWAIDDPLADLDELELAAQERQHERQQSCSLRASVSSDRTERTSYYEHVPTSDLRHMLRDAQRTIQERERDLRLAARVGSVLLDQSQQVQSSPPRRGPLRPSSSHPAGAMLRPHSPTYSLKSTSDVHRDDYFRARPAKAPVTRVYTLTVPPSTSDLSTFSDYPFPSVREDGLVQLASRPPSTVLSQWEEVQRAHARETETYRRLLALGEENDALSAKLERLVQQADQERSRDRRKADALDRTLELMQEELQRVLERNAELEQGADEPTSPFGSPAPSPQPLAFPRSQTSLLAVPDAADLFNVNSMTSSLVLGSLEPSEDGGVLPVSSSHGRERCPSLSSMSWSSRLSEDEEDSTELSNMVLGLRARISVLEQANRALCSGMLEQAASDDGARGLPSPMLAHLEPGETETPEAHSPTHPGHNLSGVTLSSTQTLFAPQLPSRERVGRGDVSLSMELQCHWKELAETGAHLPDLDDDLPDLLATLLEEKKGILEGVKLQPTDQKDGTSTDHHACPAGPSSPSPSPSRLTTVGDGPLKLRLRDSSPVCAIQGRGRARGRGRSGAVRWADDDSYGRVPSTEEVRRLGLLPRGCPSSGPDDDGGGPRSWTGAIRRALLGSWLTAPAASLYRALWPCSAYRGACPGLDGTKGGPGDAASTFMTHLGNWAAVSAILLCAGVYILYRGPPARSAHLWRYTRRYGPRRRRHGHGPLGAVRL